MSWGFGNESKKSGKPESLPLVAEIYISTYKEVCRKCAKAKELIGTEAH